MPKKHIPLQALSVIKNRYSRRKKCLTEVQTKCTRTTKKDKKNSIELLQRPQPEPGMKEEVEDDNKLICVAISDDFVLKQDICVMCGSLGNDLEGRLIVCTQCGQCYHPYCVIVRVSID